MIVSFDPIEAEQICNIHQQCNYLPNWFKTKPSLINSDNQLRSYLTQQIYHFNVKDQVSMMVKACTHCTPDNITTFYSVQLLKSLEVVTFWIR